jgi:polyhydroxyalkanoate synthase
LAENNQNIHHLRPKRENLGSGACGEDVMSKQKLDLGGGAAENVVALNPIVGVAREDLLGAVAAMLRETAGRPTTTAKHLKQFGDEVVKIVKGQSTLEPDPKDRRFHDSTWKTNPLYKGVLQYYLAVQKGSAAWMKDMKLDEIERARANFVMGMILDSVSPTNTLIGNPSALKKAYETGGGSLIKGLKNAYEDMTKNNGLVSQVDKRPFTIGKNIATSKGAVVFRNEIMEVIQYAPTQDSVHKIPLLIIPPQINKAYVNDLSADKSIIRALNFIGMQVFMVSWRNPGKQHREWGLDNYVDALIGAMDVITEITKSKKINVSGACSGGITTATLLSKLAAMGDTRVNAITLMVCVLDPRRDDTEVGALVSPHGIEMARKRSAKKGVLEGQSLARMFAWLRPNDLVWNYVVNNYLHGEDPPPFDVLFWNNDATNLAARLHSDYLRVYESQPFANPGTTELAGHVVDLRKVTQDTFIVAGVTDHITPWKACYRTTQMLGSANIEFILSHSGHIQALLNPPGNPKAKYYRNTSKPPASTDQWMMGATETAGSWWPLWGEWLTARAGEKKKAPKTLGSKAHPPLDPAPGRYVFDDPPAKR